jgi:hypothetical protein
MPIKYNLTKFDLLSTKVKKVSAKKHNGEQPEADEKLTMLKAVLIATFASGHSWQTFKALKSPPPRELNRPEIKKEHEEASSSKWRSITPFDIVEVSNLGIKDNVFSEWLFFNVPKDHYDEYKEAWGSLKKDFNGNCDDIEDC